MLFNTKPPLAERMRPSKLEDLVGQEHLVGENGVIRKTIQTGNIPSMIFWGPPGVGKTTIANIIANEVTAATIRTKLCIMTMPNTFVTLQRRMT